MDTQQRNLPLVCMFSAGQSHLLIHNHETGGNLRLWFDTLLPTFQEWVMSFESNLWLVNSNLASRVPNFDSPYGPRNDDVKHKIGFTYVFSLCQ